MMVLVTGFAEPQENQQVAASLMCQTSGSL